MGIAQAVAKRSPCLSRQVGCILLDKHKHILSTGYNGPARGVEHCKVCKRSTPGRDLYSCPAVHAEQNALLQCPDVDKIVSAYITISPCEMCSRFLANTSCEEIIFAEKYTEESYENFEIFWCISLKRKLFYLRSVQG